MKINRGNKDVVPNGQNVQDVNTKDVNAAEAPAQELKVEETKETEVPTGTKKMDTIVKIQEARKALAEKKAIEEKIQRQDEEAAEIQALLDDMKTGAVKSETVVKKIRSTMPKTKKAKRVGSAPGGHKLKDINQSDILDEIKHEEDLYVRKETAKNFLSVQNRHRKKVSINNFYSVIPEDKTYIYTDLNDNEDNESHVQVEVQYSSIIPYGDILTAIEWTLNMAIGNRAFISEPVFKACLEMAVMKFWTNLDIKEDELLDQYDILKRQDIIENISALLDQKQLKWFYEGARKTANNIIQYQNSAMGTMQNISEEATRDSGNLMKLFKYLDDNKDKIEDLKPFVQAYEDLEKDIQK